MDTAYNLPFVLKINNVLCEQFSQKEEEIYSDSFSTVKVMENDEVTILFDSVDASARLYLDALDILPEGDSVLVDEEGRLYRPISKEVIHLYKHGSEYDALRVDAFRLCVLCEGKKYYSLLEVLPKQLAVAEWKMMRDDLENEIRGLAQDIVRRNIGFGGENEGVIPPQKLYTFFVLQKYAHKVLASLIALQNAPKYQIVTEYIEKDICKAVKMDSVTIRKHLQKGGATSNYLIPVKKISYDIQENRLLKRIVSIYDRELIQFITTIEGVLKYRETRRDSEHRQYRLLYEQGLKEFLDTAQKLQKITAIIKTQEWYKTVGRLRDGAIPHAFALDSRYGVLYKMYEDLRDPNFKVQLDPNYSYSWKKSSALYEMWCYIRICRAFAERYELVGQSWNLGVNGNMLFPFLSNGVKMAFENETVCVEVIFDQFLPTKAQKSTKHDHPFYAVGKHTRPDITIDVYTKKDDWYIGSLILECKYRKLSSFWNTTSDWSSKPQIHAYYTDAKSELTYGGLGGLFDMRPIQSVIVLTPDKSGEGKGDVGINTLIKALRPENTNEMISSVMDCIEKGIGERFQKCSMVKSGIAETRRAILEGREGLFS